MTGAAVAGACAAAGSLFGCAPASSGASASSDAKGDADSATEASSNASLEAAASSAEATDWLGVEPETPTAFDEEITADVVVIGGGIAGVAACRSAIEAGATVALFEKSSDVASRSQDFVCLGSSWMEKNFPSIPSMDEVKWDLLQDTAKGSLNRTKDAIWARWADLNGETFDWWIGAMPEDELASGSEENGNKLDGEKNSVTIKMWPMPAHYDPSTELYPSYAGTAVLMGAGGTGCLAFTKANLAKAQEDGGDKITCRFDARAEKLLVEGGKVTGAVIRCYDGTTIKATAEKGVVLATGDFLNNPAMLEHFCSKESRCGYTSDKNIYPTVDKNGDLCNVGDGHKMGVWAGARIQADGCCMTHMEKQDVEAIGTDPCLWLNLDGVRFMNEDCQACHMSQRLEELPGRKIFQIFDGSIIEDLAWMPYGHHRVVNQTKEGLDAAVEAGALLRADTIDELLGMLDGIDVETARKTIERYNEMCANGRDDDFGKVATRMFPVDEAPFYCVTWGDNVSLVTLTGLESDEECHVYNENDEIIPGLYVCGNTQGNRWALEYAETCLGFTHAMAITYGRVAGKNAYEQV